MMEIESESTPDESSVVITVIVKWNSSMWTKSELTVRRDGSSELTVRREGSTEEVVDEACNLAAKCGWTPSRWYQWWRWFE